MTDGLETVTGVITRWRVAAKHLDRIGAWLSEEHLIEFDHRGILLLLGLVICFGIGTTLKLHTSSLGCWDLVITGNSSPTTRSVLIGSPRGVRADEWMVGAPFIMSQIVKGFPTENPTYGYSKTPLISVYAAVPVWHYTAIFKPQSWPFFVLSPETAFSACCWLRVFGLIGSTFLLLMLVSRNNFWLSLAGSVWLYFSTYLQWVFWGQAIDHVIAGSFAIIGLVYLLYSARRIVIVLSGILVCLALLNLFLTFYTAWQVPMAYLVMFCVGGVALNHRDLRAIRVRLTLKMAVAVTVASLIGIVLVCFWFEVRDTVSVLLATEYPGGKFNRVSGGQISAIQQLTGFFDMFYTETAFPYTNVCESTGFWPLYPVVGALALFRFLKNREVHWLEIVLLLYCSVMSIQLTLGFPRFLARISLFGKAYGSKPFLGIVVATVLLCITSLTRGSASIRRSDRVFLGFSVFSGIVIAGLGLYWRARFPACLDGGDVLLAAIAFGLVVGSLVACRRTVFALVCVGIVVLSGARVNPISRGLGPLYDKDLAAAVGSLARTDPDALWVAFGDNYPANFLKAQGVSVLNGLKYVPDLHQMAVLDPDGGQRVYYNRYAHIEFHARLDDVVRFGNASPDSSLHDHIFIEISPASPRLVELGVRFVLLPEEPVGSAKYVSDEQWQERGLIKVSKRPANGYSIWRIG